MGNPSKIFDPLKPEYDLKIGETVRKKWEIPQKINFKGFQIILEKTGNASKHSILFRFPFFGSFPC